jgi:hypothetical protein
MPPEGMESLEKDYRSEGAQLEELDLEEDYQKVRELAIRDVMWASS